MASMEHLRFYWLVNANRFSTDVGGSAVSAVDMPAKYSLPIAVGERTWDNPTGTKGVRDIIFGAIKDPDGATVAEWWHRATYEDAFFGTQRTIQQSYHGPQFGPSPEGPRVRHVASGNEYFIAPMIWPHIPLMMRASDTDSDGFFNLVQTAVDTAQSTVTKMGSNEIGDYIGYRDWHESLEPLFGTTLELLAEGV